MFIWGSDGSMCPRSEKCVANPRVRRAPHFLVLFAIIAPNFVDYSQIEKNFRIIAEILLLNISVKFR